ncbi:hypothetical protein [Stenotrophomonas sp. 278]|uniref:hypothetical protein n=1 Tax=Stenotrophomonas sp. 278 TaxID=2479851 RepID=UPI000F67733E|nr:hypothetical protein [Stenotrophomonas sp. 278]RRU17830.1 hypothetical protein EGJ34_06740 [Stenotrophomonas sp. 278]
MPDPTDTPATAPDTTPTDITADAMAALDAGIAAADESSPPPAAEPAPEPAAPVADTPPATPAADGQPPADGEQQPAQPQEGAPPADGQPPAEPDKPQPDAETEAEITALGLKDKTAERFRGLAAEVKQLAPIRDALKAAGIEDVATLPDLVQRASVGEDMVKMVTDTGTSPEQYGMALDYLGLISKAQRGDMSAAGQAYEVMSKELAVLAQMLGKEVPGVHDPLAAHADLLAEVQSGDLPRTRALEIASTRAQGAYSSSAQRQQQEAQQAAQQAEQDGIAWLQKFDADARAQDPQYVAKRPALNEAVAEIRRTMHPSQWPQATALAYARIQAPAVAAPAAPAAPAQPRPGPMRPNGPQPTMAPAFTDPMKAMEFGIEQANNAA